MMGCWELYFALLALGAMWSFVTSPDGTAFGSFLSGIGSLLGGLAAVVGVGFAIYGFDKWRKQLRGTTEYQVALRVLAGAIDYRHKLHWLREPINPLELPDSSMGGHGPMAELVYREAKEYLKRMERVEEAKQRVQVAFLEARAIWGAKAWPPLQSLMRTGMMISSRSADYFRYESNRLTKETPAPRGVHLKRLRGITYRTGKRDWLDLHLERAARMVEDWYSAYLR